jgi:hypothetical protein
MIIKSGIEVFDFEQVEAADVWTIVHNLKRLPTCDVRILLNGMKVKILPSNVEYLDENTLVVKFTDAQTGTARLA